MAENTQASVGSQDFMQSLTANVGQPESTSVPQAPEPVVVAELAKNAANIGTAMSSGFEEFASLEGEGASEPQLKDSANFKLYFRKADGKRKKLKGSTDAVELLHTVEADLSVHSVVAAGTDEDDEEEKPKKRGPKPKKETSESTLLLKFFDDVDNKARDFISSLVSPDFEYEIDLHICGETEDEDAEVFTFEGVNLVPTPRVVVLSRHAGFDPEPLVFDTTFTYTRVTRADQ